MRIVNDILVVALLAGQADAANYYVSTTGSNANAGTSLASPFLTIQQAANVAQAGDNVYVRGGTYRETVTVAHSGTSPPPSLSSPMQRRAGHGHRIGRGGQQLVALQRLDLSNRGGLGRRQPVVC